MKQFSRGIRVFAWIVGLTAFGFTASAVQPKSNELPAPAANPGSESRPLSGKVIETMDAGGYTYVCLGKSGEKTWVAVPQMSVTKGQKIEFQPGVEMKNFESKSLKRTFKSIFFSGGPLSPPAAGGGNNAELAKHEGSRAATPPAGKISVEKAIGPNAYTVGEIYAKKAVLKDKQVIVRGKVVKASSEKIMEKYWIHLQDGTGNPKKNTNDLVVTSQVPVKVGDIVVAKGSIRRDKDFGYGYKYDVIMEEASLQR